MTATTHSSGTFYGWRVVAAAFELIEDLPASFVVGNVIADEIVPAGGHRVVMLV